MQNHNVLANLQVEGIIEAITAGLQIEGIIEAITAGSAFAGIVWQSRKTRRVNTREQKENGATLKHHSKQLKKIARTLEAHIQDHQKETP